MNNPLLEELLYTVRDPTTTAPIFRFALERIGEHLGFEIAKDLVTQEQRITTSLGQTATHSLLKEELTLVTVLRAGIPLYNGLLKAFPKAESGFVGAMRNEETLNATISYIALPDIKNKIIILADTMIATGGSIVDTIKLLDMHAPKKIIVAGAFVAPEGVAKIKEYDKNIRVYAAQIDCLLNEKGYILPGLGDAGDRCYGRKV